MSLLVVVGLLVSTVLAPGVVAADTDPRFEAQVDRAVVAPGQSTDLTVTLQNDAEDPEDTADPASNVEATMEAGSTPFTVTSGTRVLGTLRDGQPVQATFAISVPQDVEPGTYEIPVAITYEHDFDEREHTTTSVTVRVEDRARFEVVGSTSDLAAGGDGPVEVTIENVGTETAEDATVRLRSKSPVIRFDGADQTSQFVGSWAAGEQRTVSVTATATPDAETRAYPLTGRVAYDDADGARRHSTPLATTVTPTEQTFDIETGESTLQVGTEGAATFRVTNTGPASVEGVSLEIIRTGPHLQPVQVSYPLGSIAAGDSAEATVPVQVSPDAEPGAREITTRVRFDGPDGRIGGDAEVTVVDVAPEQTIGVEIRENTLRVDREGDLAIAVTNTGEQPMVNANIRLSAAAPSLHPEQVEYAIGTLEPGETTTLTYSIDVGDDATPTPRTVSFAVAYDDSTGDRYTTRPTYHRVQIAPDRPVFDVSIVDAAIPVGGAGSITVSVTNNGEVPRSGIDAKAFTDAPIEVTDDSAYLGTLEPGESAEMTLGVAIPDDAQVKTYPLSVDFQSEKPDGESELSEAYDVPVRATPAESPLDQIGEQYAAYAPDRTILLGGVTGFGVAGLLAGSVGLWRRRRSDE